MALFVESLLARWLLLGCLALNATGLFFTFRRGAWIAGLLALAVALLLLSPTAKVRAGRVLVLGLVLASIAVLTTGDGSAQGSVLGSGASRIESIGAYSDDVSAQHRLAEWRAAASAIRASPIEGIGLGTSITFQSPRYSPSYHLYGVTWETIYIHNSAIWYWLKLGLFGLLGIVGLIATFLRSGISAYHARPNTFDGGLALASLVTLGALILLSFTEGIFNYDGSVPFVVSLGALLCSLAPLGASADGQREH